jgi:hypothetical protein
VIVRDLGDAWQIVLQTDHADLSGELARAWADKGPHHGGLEVAAERHDDGWAVWEQAPMIDGGSHAPVNFLDVHVPAHLAFYRAGIAAITEEDPYAGLLVSMHGAGIYKQRYGTDPSLGLSRATEVADLILAFVDEQEASHPGRAEAAGVDEDRRWADYRLLQLYDRLSLYFCMRDGESAELMDWRIEPIEPWRIRLDPYPFAERPLRCSLVRHVLPKREWTLDEFRTALAETEPDRTEITIEAP